MMKHGHYCSYVLVSGLAVALAFSDASAQKKIGTTTGAEAYVSKIMNRKPGETLSGYLGHADGSYQIKVEGGGKREIVSFNDQLDEVSRRPVGIIKVPQEKGEKAHRQFLEFGDKMWLLKATTERSAQVNEFSLIEINADGDEVGQKRDLGRVEGADFFIMAESADLDYVISPGGSKLLVQYKLPLTQDEKREDAVKNRFVLLDKGGNIIWQYDQKCPDHDRFYQSFRGVTVTDEGDVFFYAMVKRPGQKPGGDGYGVEVFRIRDGMSTSTNVSGYLLTSASTWVEKGEYNIVFSPGSRNFNFMGLGKSNKCWGLVGIQWKGEKGSKARVVEMPFTTEHAIKNQPKGEYKKYSKADKEGKVWIPYATLQETAILPNGNRLIFVQESYSVTKTSNSGMVTTTYYYLDLHVFAIDGGFNVIWSTIVPINQASKDDSSLGYVQYVNGDRLHILFNDSKKNFEKWELGMKPNRYSGGSAPLAIVTIDMKEPDAKQRREKLFMSSTVGGNMFPYLFFPIEGKSSGLIYIQGGKLKYSLVRLDFK